MFLVKDEEDDDNASMASTEPGDPENVDPLPSEDPPAPPAEAPSAPSPEQAAPALPATAPSTEPAGSKAGTDSAKDSAPVSCLMGSKLDYMFFDMKYVYVPFIISITHKYILSW